MSKENKRTRIGSATDSQKLGQTPEQNVESNNISEEPKNEHSEFYDSDGNFIWEAYEATCVSHTRKPNPHIKTQKGDKVYSREDYAQEMYDMLQNSEINRSIKSSVKIGEIHEGIVYAVTQDTITVDIGYRELIYVKADKEPQSVKELTPGEETAVLITNTDNAFISGSVSGGIKQKVFMDLRDGVESGNTAWVGLVKNMIENGGYIVEVQGIECFMPGSLAGINKLADFESIVGEELYVVPVSFSATRGTIVVSHRKYLQALIPQEIENIKENAGEEITGNVTGTAKYGVFVEFNRCLTGMIHKNDLDPETFEKFKKREIMPADEVTFKVKDVISNTKITLTQIDNVQTSPWDDITTRYKIPAVVKAQVKAKKDYGLFVTIEDGVTGLLHVSELGEDIMKVFNPGDDITVKITRIEEETQKVFLKLP